MTSRSQPFDALRGFALLGVCIANVQHFSGSSSPKEGAWHVPWLDHMTRFSVNALVDGKFYSLFALLFGFGLALQLERLGPTQSKVFVRRRLAVLLGLGLLHATLLWYGDILALYALLGWPLLAFRRSSQRQLLLTSVGLFAVPVLLHAMFLLLMPVSTEAHPEQVRIATAAQVAGGSYLQLVRWNVMHGLAQRGFDLFGTGRPFKVLALFLLGMAAARAGWLTASPQRTAVLRNILRWGLVVGIPCNLALAVCMESPAYERLEPIGLLQPLFYAYGVPALSLVYGAGFLLACEQPTLRRYLSSLSYAGRLSLSNYVLQSLLGATIFYSWGLGWFGQLGSTAAVLLAASAFTLEAVTSRAWLRRFRLGPLEWLWRRLAYASPLPLGYAHSLPSGRLQLEIGSTTPVKEGG